MKSLWIAHWLISIMGAAFFGIVTYMILNWFYEGRSNVFDKKHSAD